MAGAHVHEPGVRGHVIDPVRDRRPGSVTGEVVVPGPDRVPFRPPFPPGLRERPDLLLLLSIHADHRLPRGQVLLRLRGDIPELAVPVRVPPALHGPGVSLRGEPLLVQQPPAGLRAARVALPAQRVRQVLHAPGRPHQRRLRVPAGGILHQRQQRRHQARVGLRQGLAAPARAAHPARRHGIPRLQLRLPVRHRLPRRPRHRSHRAGPPVPGRPRHRPQHQPPRPLIQRRQQQLQLRPHQLQKPGIRAHTRTIPETHHKLTLFWNLYRWGKTRHRS